MSELSASAMAHPNIAFIKYWGNMDDQLNLPANGSISMNLGDLITTTHIQFKPDLPEDRLWINSIPIQAGALRRVSTFLDHVRQMVALPLHAEIHSQNNFPASAGIASSASAFAALALAASHAAGLTLSQAELSALARLGSGSAARSIPAGFVEWHAASTHLGSYAETFAEPDHWALIDLVVIVQQQPKETGSTEGHQLAQSSPLQPVRASSAAQRLKICRQAILEKDFPTLAQVIELDSNLMHAAMMTSSPPLFYWEPLTLQIIKSVPTWRKAGLNVAYTIDAGANVHLICEEDSAAGVKERVEKIPGMQTILRSTPGAGARLIKEQAHSTCH